MAATAPRANKRPPLLSDAPPGEQPATPVAKSIAFEPLFTPAQIEKFEADYNPTWGVKRRIMMFVLARHGTHYAATQDARGPDDLQIFATMSAQIGDYRAHLLFGAELARRAMWRLDCVAAYLAHVSSRTKPR